ncbi:MAG: alpha/beta fold hydrolase [Pseudomonadota bacterium]
MPETVFLIHGIWMTGLEMQLLARRVRACGYHTEVFSYRSLLRPLLHNAARLADRVRQQDVPTVHLVGHSLGGLVILQALQDHPDLINGRIVLLGSPVNGSVIAKRVQRYPFSSWSLGRSGRDALLGNGPRWQGRLSLGVIAGTRPVGIGRLLGGFDGDNDGTVAVDETEIAGSSSAMTVNTGHFGLLYSTEVAQAVCAFLRQGRFAAAAALV